jgi:hypothetical protein
VQDHDAGETIRCSASDFAEVCVVYGGDNVRRLVADVTGRAVVWRISGGRYQLCFTKRVLRLCLLQWSSAKDAVTKCAETDCGVMTGVCAIVDVDFEEPD